MLGVSMNVINNLRCVQEAEECAQKAHVPMAVVIRVSSCNTASSAAVGGVSGLKGINV